MAKKTTVRRKGKRKTPAGFKKWQAHLAAYRKKHPNLSLKEAMKRAKQTYKK